MKKTIISLSLMTFWILSLVLTFTADDDLMLTEVLLRCIFFMPFTIMMFTEKEKMPLIFIICYEVAEILMSVFSLITGLKEGEGKAFLISSETLFMMHSAVLIVSGALLLREKKNVLKTVVIIAGIIRVISKIVLIILTDISEENFSMVHYTEWFSETALITVITAFLFGAEGRESSE